MSTQNYSMMSGDSKTLTVNVVDGDGVAVDVSTAAAIVYEIAASPAAATSYVSKALTTGVTVATSTVTVTLAPADTKDLAGVYYHELEITDASGHVFTAFSGYVTIARDLIT